MAFKQQANHTVFADELPSCEPMRFRVPGLRWIHDDEFELEGLFPVQLDYGKVRDALLIANIPAHEADVYTERFIRMVQTGELARALAERMERAG